MEKIGLGRTAEVFKDADGNAVKLFFDRMPETEARKEADVLQRVSLVCGLAPEFRGLVRVGGRNGFRCELIAGCTASQRMLGEPLRALGLARAAGRLHRQIHAARADGLRPAETVYGPAIRASGLIGEGARERLLEFLRGRNGASLCHGDFHLENILIDDAGRTRVIDWVNAYSGDPLSDAARSYFLMRYGRSPNKKAVWERLLEAFAKPLLASAYLRGYFEKDRFPREDFRRWLLAVMIHRYEKERIAEEEKELKAALASLLRRMPCG